MLTEREAVVSASIPKVSIRRACWTGGRPAAGVTCEAVDLQLLISLPVSSARIASARIVEWVTTPSHRSSRPGMEAAPALVQLFNTEAHGKPRFALTN